MPGLEPVRVKYLPQVQRLLKPQLSRHTHIHIHPHTYTHTYIHIYTYIHICIYACAGGIYIYIHVCIYQLQLTYQESECKFNMQPYSSGFPSTLQYHLHAKVTKMKAGRQWDPSPASQTTMSQLHSDPNAHFCKMLKELVTMCFPQRKTSPS